MTYVPFPVPANAAILIPVLDSNKELMYYWAIAPVQPLVGEPLYCDGPVRERRRALHELTLAMQQRGMPALVQDPLEFETLTEAQAGSMLKVALEEDEADYYIELPMNTKNARLIGDVTSSPELARFAREAEFAEGFSVPDVDISYLSIQRKTIKGESYFEGTCVRVSFTARVGHQRYTVSPPYPLGANSQIYCPSTSSWPIKMEVSIPA